MEQTFPRRFGKYTLLSKLATGGMAELFLAMQKSVAGFEKMVVLKRILPNLAQDEHFITMLLEEARIAATLNHGNIVHIYDVGVDAGQYYIAMEHVHGEDLRTIVRAMKQHGVDAFPLEHSLAIVMGCAAGLAHAHEQVTLDGRALGIVHRDVSPQNILVTFNGEVKLVDFGIAKAGRSRGESTAAGKLKGKVPYMSPEQAQGLPIDARSDVFSLGVILFELATTKRLFRGPTEYDTLRMIIEEPYPAPLDVCPDLPPDLAAIIEKALARNPDDRFQTARELGEALEELVRKEKLAVSPRSLATWMHKLFREKLQEQQKLLHEGKKLADVLATQAEMEERLRETERFSFMPSLAPRKPAKSSAPWWALGLLALGIVAGGGLYVWKRYQDALLHAGAIQIETTPPGAAIWVDGERQRERAPTTLRSLPLGARFSIKVTADGYEPITRDVSLSRDHMEEHLRFHLLRAGPAPVAVLRVQSRPPGAHVFLDGHDTGALTPATLTGVAPGVSHNVTCALDGYEPREIDVTLNAGDVAERELTLARIPLGANEAEIQITTTPADARVRVDGALLPGTSPFEVRVPAHTARIVVERDGYRSSERAVVLPAGQATIVGIALTHDRAEDEFPRSTRPQELMEFP